MPLIDITDLLTVDGGWALPDWPAIAERIAFVPAEKRSVAWGEATRQWLDAFQAGIGPNYEVYESPTVQILGPRHREAADLLLHTAHYCRTELRSLLSEIGDFDDRGKDVLICFSSPDYYSYLSGYSMEGEHGGSAGCQIRDGYPHIVLNGLNVHSLASVVAHEMTHGVLHSLGSPQWLEEGITQYVERVVTNSRAVDLSTTDARAMARHWTRNGLAAFWWGRGFHAAGQVQRYSYQLASVLMHILIEEHRPSLFGFSRKKLNRLLDFVRHAKAADAGQAAAIEHLTFDLGELAAKYLGPGDWNPKTGDRDATTEHDEASPEGK